MRTNLSNYDIEGVFEDIKKKKIKYKTKDLFEVEMNIFPNFSKNNSSTYKSMDDFKPHMFDVTYFKTWTLVEIIDGVEQEPMKLKIPWWSKQYESLDEKIESYEDFIKICDKLKKKYMNNAISESYHITFYNEKESKDYFRLLQKYLKKYKLGEHL